MSLVDMADAITVAYVYLNKRERTVGEVRSRLEKVVEKEDCTQKEADAAVEELLELGYLDDARYARLFVEDKRNLESWGTERIQRALAERGVERDVISAALSAAATGADESELDRAVELLRRRFPEPAVEDARGRERAFGMLVRKGYDSELAGDAVRCWIRS
jgi:regulatory protein